jgi:HEAT repeat protein
MKTISQPLVEQQFQEQQQKLLGILNGNFHMKMKLTAVFDKETDLADKNHHDMEKRKRNGWQEIEWPELFRDDSNFILQNSAGFGKTVFLNDMALALLKNHHLYYYLSLFVTARTWCEAHGDLTACIQARLDKLYFGLIQPDWDNLVIILDGLEHAENMTAIWNSFKRENKPLYYKQAKIIAAARPDSAAGIPTEFIRIRLIKPEKSEILCFFGAEPYESVKALLHDQQELFSVPFMLKLLKDALSRGVKFREIKNRAELFDQFITGMVSQKNHLGKVAGLSDSLVRCLAKLAYTAIFTNAGEYIDKQNPAIDCQSSNQAENYLQTALSCGLIIEQAGKIAFCHPSFRNYFAAKYIHLENPAVFQQFQYAGYFFNETWFEVMQFYLGFDHEQAETQKLFNRLTDCNNQTNKIDQVMQRIFACILFSEMNVREERIIAFYKELSSDLAANLAYLNLFARFSRKFNSGNFCQRKHTHLILQHFLNHPDAAIVQMAVKITGDLGCHDDIRLVEDLPDDKNAEIRAAAAEAIGKLGDAGDMDLLKTLLEDHHDQVRLAAVAALDQLMDSLDISVMEPLLLDANFRVFQAAVALLVNHGFSDPKTTQNPFIWHRASAVKLAAAMAMEHLTVLIPRDQSEFLLNELLEALAEEPDQEAYIHACQATGKYCQEIDLPQVETFLSHEHAAFRIGALEALARLKPDDAVSLLEPLLEDDDDQVCCAALGVLGRVGSKKDIPLLEPLLEDKNTAVCICAVKALAGLGSAEDLPWLQPLLADKELDVVAAALDTFLKIASAKDHDVLRPLLLAEDIDVRRLANQAFSVLFSGEDMSLVVPYLKEDESLLRSAALQVLAEIGNSQDVPLLEPLLNDEDENVRINAIETLAKIGSPQQAVLVEPFFRCQEDYVAQAAVNALAELGNAAHLPLLINYLQDESSCVFQSAANALPKILSSGDGHYLKPLLSDENDEIRLIACQALSAVCTPQDLPILIPLLTDNNDHIRLQAVKALKKTGTIKEINLLEPLLKDKRADICLAALEVAAEIGQVQHITLLEPLLAVNHTEIRCLAIKTLAQWGTAKDLPLLLPQFQSAKAEVRQTAAQALPSLLSNEALYLVKPLLTDKTSAVRLAAIQTVGKLATRDDLHLLEPFMNDDDWQIRDALADAINSINQRLLLY